jgi:hypothetical protein
MTLYSRYMNAISKPDPIPIPRLADKDHYHLSMPDNSFRDYWSRQSHKGRIEIIATAVAALVAGFIVFYMLLR